MRRFLVFALTLCLCGCSNKKPLELADGCQPLLGGADCFLPYPSDFYRVEDAAQRSGFRLETRGASRLLLPGGLSADVHGWKAMDGFSKIPVLVTMFPADVSPEGFVALADDPAQSITPASNTLLVEAGTGELIPHFVDLDPRATDPLRRAIVIHPLVGLKAGTRYVVGLHGVRDTQGALVAAPEGFKRLRDGEAAGDPALEPFRARFERDVFPVLSKAAVPKAGLQLAWDFTTGTDESVEADLLRVRELTLAWLAANEPVVTIEQVDENPAPDLWRRVRGTVTGPLFNDTADPGAKLVRDDAGQVRQNGTTAFVFEAQLPVSVRDQFGPGRVLFYGHGFFGGLNPETHAESARHIADRLGAVMFATEWWGMSAPDLPKVADALVARPSRIMDFSERVPQGMANWLVLTNAVGRSMKAVPALSRPTTAAAPGVSTQGGASNQGQLTYQGPAANFIGISMGGILGGTLAALDPDLKRVALNVGGAGFTHMMMRARPFEGFMGLLELSIKDPLTQQAYLATLQRQFDRFDPATWAPHVLADKLPGSPADRRVVYQVGLGDSSVPNLGSALHARLLGLPVVTPSPVSVFGLPEVASPFDGSALCLYDFKLDTAALYKEAQAQPSDNGVHEGVRKLSPVLEQLDQFFSTGRVVNACSGVCDPE
jgi:hypothetical protein